jgi:hypothetical protein
MPRASKANITQSKTAVNSHAAAGDPMQKLAGGAVAGQTGSWDDLGGPTPDNYKPDDDSAELEEPGKGLSRVHDVIRKHKGHQEGDQAMPKLAPGAVKGVAEDAEYDEDEEILEACDDEDEEDEDEDEDGSKKEDKKSKKSEDDDDEETYDEEFDVEDDVNALVENEDLSEEFKVKAKTIFEAALRSKVSQIQESMEAQYQEALLEEVEVIKEELTDRVDSYLEYVAEEWLYENQLSVTRGLKEELTQSFLSGLKALCEDHYVELPEEKYDVLENMVNKLDEMETKLNEQIEKNVYLNQQLSESVADQIFNSVSGGLAVTQKEKLASLAESVEFESEDQYRDKLVTLRESYFPVRSAAAYSQPETLSEGVDYDPSPYQQVSDSMSMYLQAASLLAKH